MHRDWQTSRYYSLGDTPACDGWRGDLAERVGGLYPASTGAIHALSTAEADALVDRVQAGKLRGSTELSELLYAMFPTPLVRPATAENIIADAIEEVIFLRCPTSSLAPKPDDGSSSMRASADQKSATIPIIAVIALAYIMLS